jgi:hypothetical protein
LPQTEVEDLRLDVFLGGWMDGCSQLFDEEFEEFFPSALEGFSKRFGADLGCE